MIWLKLNLFNSVINFVTFLRGNGETFIFVEIELLFSFFFLSFYLSSIIYLSITWKFCMYLVKGEMFKILQTFFG